MKATGIVRRIDDLGRVVIPKEIRRSLRVREGDPLELFIEGDGVVFKKYSSLSKLEEMAEQYAKALNKTSGCIVYITNTDSVIAAAGGKHSGFEVEAPISSMVEDLIRAKKAFISSQQSNPIAVLKDKEECKYPAQVVIPIATCGDGIGSIILFSENATIETAEIRAAETAAVFLASLTAD